MSKFEANAITWFEIPTTDFSRATTFYEAMLDKKLIPFPGDEPCSMFPHGDDGISGALVKRDNHDPCNNGSMVYLNVDGQLDATLERVARLNAKVLVPRTQIPGGFGFYACVCDTEGNHVGLHSRGA
jgi:predicted enzyme related to lactoylglutathione lyase